MTLLLCTGDGEVLGTLPPYEIASPWWQDVGPVLDAARALYAVDATVLRRIDEGGGSKPQGGPVTYLAEVACVPTARLQPWSGDDPIAEKIHRQPSARPGGPAADLAWADEALDNAGRPRTSQAEQVRTWNLSSIWRLPTAAGFVWLKAVPPFFAHEGEMLARLDPAAVPRVLACDGHRMLLDDVPGNDLYDAELPDLLRMVTALVRLQAHWTARVGELEGLGLPDWRCESLGRLTAHVLVRTESELDRATCAGVERLLSSMDKRFAEVADCGVPDSIVHGDFHPGNTRGDRDRIVLLDWGDCGIGHPMLDQSAFLEPARAAERRAIEEHWVSAWRSAVPGSDPARAAALLAPIGALRKAVIFRRFLDAIEEDEQVYHRDDPAIWLRRAAEISAS